MLKSALYCIQYLYVLALSWTQLIFMEIFAAAVPRSPDTTSAVSAVSQTPLMPGTTDTTYSASALSDISKNSGNVSDNAD
jgi:hypothetical protein